ncbi:helix-turn-helix transcriptional regulator [Naasia sp. SYSU D00948]|uniref:helix-turn-helix transcriptional regulator n=1 Tax=Naasia sp. SYSU D00948 TaxID=2817379 RepID=UPI001B310C2E|nr:helix-turn-helix transcriptional regulator [Naasia sp. SYSU D00948]
MTAKVLHHEFRTADPEVAEEALLGSYLKARMRPATPGTPFRFEEEFHGTDRVSIGRTVFTGGMTGTSVLGDYLTAGFAVSGRLDWEVRGTRGTASDAVLLQAGDAMAAEWGPLDAVMLSLDRAAVARTAALLYGGSAGRVRFESPLPASERLARYFRGVVERAREMMAGDAFESPLVRASLYRSLAVAVLEGFQLRGDRDTRAFSVAGLAVVHRRARRFFEDYASLPITVEDAAQFVGVSGTEILRAFAVFSAVTPAQYLRSVRLSAAHADLERGDPSRGDTVRAVALRWGFADAGRFARHHREAYGVNPRTVLHA